MNRDGIWHVYKPTADWIGCGKNHWMVVHQYGATSGESHSGVGDTLEEAMHDFIKYASIGNCRCDELDIVTLSTQIHSYAEWLPDGVVV